MEFLNPWGWWGLLAIPAIIALHFFRRRFRTIPVGSILFWAQIREKDQQGRTIKPIRNSLSLWLQILAAFLLAVLLAGPQTIKRSGERELVIVLDSSYSLNAMADDRRSVADVIRKDAGKLIQSATPGSRFTIVEHGPTPRLLTSRRAAADAALAAVSAWVPASARSDWSPTIELVRLWDEKRQEVFVYSDLLTDQWNVVRNVSFTAHGLAGSNLAITDGSRIHLDQNGRERIRATVQNFSKSSVTSKIRLKEAGREIQQWDFTADAGGVWHLDVEIEPRRDSIELELPEDNLDFDNRIALAPSLRMPTEVLLDFHASGYAQAWRKVLHSLDVKIVDYDHSSTSIPPSVCLVITDDTAWLGSLKQDACVLLCATNSANVRIFRPPFLSEANHPLVRGMDWTGSILALGDWDGNSLENQIPRVSTLERSVISEIPASNSRKYLFHADMLKGNFTRQPAFPILTHNLLEVARSHQPGLRSPNIHPLEAIEYRIPQGTDILTIRQGNWKQDFHAGSAIRVPPDKFGVFDIICKGMPMLPLAINPNDAHTSDLQHIKDGKYKTDSVIAGTYFKVLDDEWVVGLLLLVLAIMYMEWWIAAKNGTAYTQTEEGVR